MRGGLRTKLRVALRICDTLLPLHDVESYAKSQNAHERNHLEES